MRTNLDSLISNWLSNPRYLWMKNRITSMKKDWIRAIKSLNKKRPLTKRTKKKVYTYTYIFICILYVSKAY